MISYEEYKKIVLSIMNDVYESEKQRRNAARRLKTELNKLRETVNFSDPDKFDKILHELSLMDSIGEKYNFAEFDNIII